MKPKKGTYLELDQDEMEYVDGGLPHELIGFDAGLIVDVIGIILAVDAKRKFLSFIGRWTLRILGIAASVVSCISALRAVSRVLVESAAKAILCFVGASTSFTSTIMNEIW